MLKKLRHTSKNSHINLCFWHICHHILLDIHTIVFTSCSSNVLSYFASLHDRASRKHFGRAMKVDKKSKS